MASRSTESVRGNGTMSSMSSVDGTGNLKSATFDDLEQLRLQEELERPASVFDDLEALKISLDDDDDVSEEVLTTIPIRRPGKKFFMAHPSPQYLFMAHILEDIENKVVYYVTPAVARVTKAESEIKKVALALCVNRVGVMFFWPIPTTGTFYASGLKAVELARKSWIKAIGQLSLGGFRTRVATTDFGPPAWPEEIPSLNQLLELAFHGNIIDKLDHPALSEQ